jgi:mono/diheme cytochrome c family protein
MHGNTLVRLLGRWLLAMVWLAALLLAGCQQQMADQPSFRPLEPCEFFDDGRSARPAVPGTVARGHLRIDTALFTGRRPDAHGQRESVSPSADPASVVQAPTGTPASAADNTMSTLDDNSQFVDQFPLPVDEGVIQHGYHRYMIYCVVCHDPLGTGQGKIVERGYTAPPSFHVDRLRDAPVGRFFAVVTEGYGSMPSYATQIPVDDRWAIVAYVRALQLSQHFPADQLTDQMRKELAGAASEANTDSKEPARPQGGAP